MKPAVKLLTALLLVPLVMLHAAGKPNVIVVLSDDVGLSMFGVRNGAAS